VRCGVLKVGAGVRVSEYVGGRGIVCVCMCVCVCAIEACVPLDILYCGRWCSSSVLLLVHPWQLSLDIASHVAHAEIAAA
jgi:hypothetical protein